MFTVNSALRALRIQKFIDLSANCAHSSTLIAIQLSPNVNSAYFTTVIEGTKKNTSIKDAPKVTMELFVLSIAKYSKNCKKIILAVFSVAKINSLKYSRRNTI